MGLFKVLLISAFIFLQSIDWGGTLQPEDCDDLSLNSTITLTEAEGSKVEIEAKGGQAPYKYLFYKPSGHLLSEEFDDNSVSKLQKGKYFCTVIDKKGCYKTIEIEIK